MASTSMTKEFHQNLWDDDLRAQWDQILRLAIREDLGERGDWTTAALVPEDAAGHAAIVARQPGVLAGEPAVADTLRRFDNRLRWQPAAQDGQTLVSGQVIGRIDGPARGLLAAERTLLNFLGRLSGIATLTRKYVDAVAGTRARIYDTRKTTPGWRGLEKYAVRCGGGWNHRGGLFEALLIKDNHLALGRGEFSPAEAVARARRFLADRPHGDGGAVIVEVEVDTLEQLAEVLPAEPDLILLDNMSLAQLREAVLRRDARRAAVELEASGGVGLATVRRIAETGVERISVGALTHSAAALDLGLDWQ
jgi:nicotinate-nucleotide pyrophosphorylase (carboxylating)